MYEDDHDLRAERSAHRWRVAMAIAGVLGTLALIVFKLARMKDDAYERRGQEVLAQALAEQRSRPQPVASAWDAPVVSTRPVEFEVEVDGKRYDVISYRSIALADGRELHLERTPAWTSGAERFHFRHASSIQITTSPDRAIAAHDGASVEIWVAADLGARDLERRLLEGVRATGQRIGSAVAATRDIGGGRRKGSRYEGEAGASLEVYVFALAPKLQLAVTIQQFSASADLAPLDELLVSLRAGAAEPAPHFAVRRSDVPIFLDRSAQVVLERPTMVTVRRRPAILQTFEHGASQLTLEYPRGTVVTSEPRDGILTVTLVGALMNVQLFAFPMPMSLGDLIEPLRAARGTRDLGAVTRSHAGETLRGHQLELSPGLRTELFVLERAGTSIGVAWRYAAVNEREAAELTLPILASVR